MKRFKLILEYDGTGLAGWQKQPDRPSVQGFLEQAAEKFCGAPAEVVAAGRTDAGVHATAQAAHLDVPRDCAAYNVMQGINFHLLELSPQIIIHHAEGVADDFHARFSAVKRHYHYRIVNRRARLSLNRHRAWHIVEELDAQAMHRAAQLLIGHHDFQSFRSNECQAKSPEKTLDTLNVARNGDVIDVTVSARSFLHHQVRNMVGTLRLIGNGKWNDADLIAALKARNRSAAGETAPPQGLYLTQVDY